MGLAGNLAVQSSINFWFQKKKPMAMAVALSSGGVGGFAGPLVLRYFVTRSGWAAGWWCIAAINMAILLITALLLVNRPEDIGETPDGYGAAACAAADQAPERAYSAKDLFQLKSFRYIMVNYISRTAIYYAFSGFAVLYLVRESVTYADAVAAVSVISGVSLLSRLLVGAIAERYVASNILLGAGNILMSVGVLIVTFFPAPLSAVTCGAAVFGLGVGAVNVSLPLTFAGFYGAQNFAAVSGYATPVNYLIGAFGPLLVGYCAAELNGYFLPFSALAIFSVIGGVAAMVAKEGSVKYN